MEYYSLQSNEVVLYKGNASIDERKPNTEPGFRVTGSAGRKNTAFPVFFLSLPSLIH